MALARFDSLPLEVLEDVCWYLYAWPGSLKAFALVNRWCYSICRPQVHREIRLALQDDEKLLKDVEHWTQTLEKSSSFRHVRQLKIMQKITPGVRHYVPMVYDEPYIGDDESDDDLANTSPTPYKLAFPPPPDHQRDGWKSVAAFVRQLPLLTDLVYKCVSQLPQCVLEALQPQCRLHLRTFYLGELMRPPTEEVTGAHQYELALAASPNLYSAIIGFHNEAYINGNFFNDKNRLVLGLTPNLKRLRMFSRPGHGRYRHPIQPFSDTNSSLIRLQQLNMKSWWMRGLQKDIDLTELVTLKTECTIKDVGSLAQFDFRALKTLVAVIAPQSEPEGPPSRRIAAAPWIGSLPPLDNLRLTGPQYRPASIFLEEMSEILECVLQTHGQSLRKLCWEPCRLTEGFLSTPIFDDSTFCKIRDSCHILVDLQVQVCRSLGDKREVATYRTLGTFPHLKHIGIRFMPTTASIEESSWPPLSDYVKDIAKQPFALPGGFLASKGTLFALLINWAIDQDLCRCIFQEIVQTQRKIFGYSTLKSLKITSHTYRLGDLYNNHDSSMRAICERVNADYLCYPSPRDDSDEIVVEKILQYISNSNEIHQKYLDLIADLWPVISGHWEKDWYSFPLDTDWTYNISASQ